MLVSFLLALANVSSPAVDKAASESARRAVSAAAGMALQGRMSEAIPLLNAIPEAQLGAKDRQVRQCMLERFGAGSTPPGPSADGDLVHRAAATYQAYWWSALTRPNQLEKAEAELTRRLRRLLALPAGAPWNEVEKRLHDRLAADGVRALAGRTPPFLEFMAWKTETVEERDVPLPEAAHQIQVKFLNGFASLGWSAYATCEHSFTGGWVQSDGIYAVEPGWKSLADESFRISFLAHETQHFADRARFGDLDSWILEYRAKLAELAMATTSLPRLLDKFQSSQGDDPAVPHPYANRLVLRHVRELTGLADDAELSGTDAGIVRQAALRLLLEDSASRDRPK